jgi:hypothetical protein
VLLADKVTSQHRPMGLLGQKGLAYLALLGALQTYKQSHGQEQGFVLLGLAEDVLHPLTGLLGHINQD